MREPFGDSGESQLTPPTDPSSGPAKWPTPVGIISIVIGSWGLLSGVLGAVAILFLDSYLGMIGQASPEPQMMQAMLDVMQQWRGFQVMVTLAGAVLGALLLVGGVLVLKRRRSSVGLVRGWALLRMVVVLGNLWVSFRIQQAVFTGAQTPELAGAFGNVFALMSAVVGLLIGWAYPVFVLVWFARKKIRQDVASWT